MHMYAWMDPSSYHVAQWHIPESLEMGIVLVVFMPTYSHMVECLAWEEMAIAMKRVEKFAESHLGKLTED